VKGGSKERCFVTPAHGGMEGEGLHLNKHFAMQCRSIIWYVANTNILLLLKLFKKYTIFTVENPFIING
jgi:hypothetical protein